MEDLVVGGMKGCNNNKEVFPDVIKRVFDARQDELKACKTVAPSELSKFDASLTATDCDDMPKEDGE